MAARESVARRELRRRIAAHDLDRDTLELIADALRPRNASKRRLEDAEVAQVNEAIDMLILSGLKDGPAIAEELRAHRAENEADWRETFWRQRVSLATAAQGDATGATAAEISTVAAIPPQPPSELGEQERRSDRLAA